MARTRISATSNLDIAFERDSAAWKAAAVDTTMLVPCGNPGGTPLTNRLAGVCGRVVSEDKVAIAPCPTIRSVWSGR
jgi:hypothetical protein